MHQTMTCPFCSKEIIVSPKLHYEKKVGYQLETSMTLCGNQPVSARDGDLIARGDAVVNCKICIRIKKEMDAFFE